MSEKVFFQRGEVTVTTTRLMVGSKTFSINNIVSTRGLEITPGLIGKLFGAKSEFVVQLSTAAGDVEAYKSEDSDFISDLLNALDEAIASRS